MPPVIAAIAAAGSIGGAIAGAGTVGALLINAAVAIGVSVGVSYLAAALTGRPRTPKPSSLQQETQQTIPPRMWHYGRVNVSGPLGCYEATQGENNWLVKIVLISARRISGYEKFYVDDSEVTLSPSGFLEGYRWNIEDDARARVRTRIGESGQTASDTLIAHLGPLGWGADHRLDGIAYLAGFFQAPDPEDFNKVYPNGEPVLRAQLRGCRLYDPRLDSTVAGGAGPHRHDNQDTWGWTDLAGLAVLDFVTHPDGYNRPIAAIDLPSFVAFAQLCDQPVPLKGGGTELRYRIATTVILTEKRTEVLRRLLEACDGELHFTAAGQWAIRGGAWEPPTVTLDAEAGEIVDASFSAGSDALERYNDLAIMYLSPAHRFTEQEGGSWSDDADIAATGVVETRPFDVVQVPSQAQARRLAKIRMARDNPDWIGEVVTNFAGLDCIGERAVTLRWPELEIDGPFWIDKADILADFSGVRLKVRSARPSAYDWNAALEEVDGAPVPPDDNDIVIPSQVAALGAAGGVGEVELAWTNPPESYFTHAVVWRAEAGESFADAVAISGVLAGDPGEAMDHTDGPLAAGDYLYWVTTHAGGGTAVVSPPRGPIAATAT